MEACFHHCLAFFETPQSRLLECPSARRAGWLTISSLPCHRQATASSISLAMAAKPTSAAPRIQWLKKAAKASMTPGFSVSASSC